MKLTTSTPNVKTESIEIQEHFSQQNGIPCIDYVIDGYLVARQENHQLPVGQAFRIINKLYTLPEPIPYTDATAVDVSGINPDVSAFQGFVGAVVPTAPKKNNKPA